MAQFAPIFKLEGTNKGVKYQYHFAYPWYKEKWPLGWQDNYPFGFFLKAFPNPNKE